MSATDIGIGCPEDGCENNLRAREHGPVRAWPRRNRTSDALVAASDVAQCVAFQRDGERCEHEPADDARVCGVHGGSLAAAAKAGFRISTAAYASAVHLSGPASPHVRMVERERPRGREVECAHHGREPGDGGGFPEHVRQAAFERAGLQ